MVDGVAGTAVATTVGDIIAGGGRGGCVKRSTDVVVEAAVIGVSEGNSVRGDGRRNSDGTLSPREDAAVACVTGVEGGTVV